MVKVEELSVIPCKVSMTRERASSDMGLLLSNACNRESTARPTAHQCMWLRVCQWQIQMVGQQCVKRVKWSLCENHLAIPSAVVGLLMLCTVLAMLSDNFNDSAAFSRSFSIA